LELFSLAPESSIEWRFRSEMKRAFVIALMAGGVLLAQGPRVGRMGFGRHPEAMPFHGATVTDAPFSAVQVTTHQQTLANGNTIQRQEQTKLFRDSQGRVREETTWSGRDGQGSRTVVTISDPVAQVVRRLNPQSKTAFEMTMGQPHASGARGHAAGNRRTHQDSANVVKEDLGTQTINGVPATGTRVTRTIAAGAVGNEQPIQLVREMWVSNDLKVPVTIKVTDPRFGTTTTQLTGITRAEPDAALFQTPADYSVGQRHGLGRHAQ
jgi:hypothetical protein